MARLSWLGHLLVTLTHLHGVEVNGRTTNAAGMDMDEDDGTAENDAVLAATMCRSCISGGSRRCSGFRSAQQCERISSKSSSLPPIATLVAG